MAIDINVGEGDFEAFFLFGKAQAHTVMEKEYEELRARSTTMGKENEELRARSATMGKENEELRARSATIEKELAEAKAKPTCMCCVQ